MDGSRAKTEKIYAEYVKCPRGTLTRQGSQFGALALVLQLILGSGCQTPTGPSPTLSASPTPAVSGGSPTVMATPLSSEEISQRYQASVENAENGWPELKGFLEGSDDWASSGMESAAELDLDRPADAATFDGKILPALRSAFTKPAFTGTPKLLSGHDPINPHYRDLRALCDLLTQRADQLWTSGKKEQALELVELPLSLAHSLQSRPETVSVNDFSSKYAAVALATIADWASTNTLVQPQLDTLISSLAKYRPDYDHMALSISVDFASLENSLDNQEVRTGILGLGLSQPEEIQQWKEQLRSLLGEAQKLYGLTPIDAKAFNDAILKLAPPIQGIVVDYPNIAAMQKRTHASYLATELALTLEKHRLAKSKEPLTAEQVFEQTFASDTSAQKVAQALLEVRPGPTPSQFTIAGRSGMFTLLSPDPNIIFYQR